MEDSGYRYFCAAGETFDSVALVKYQDEKFAADLLCMNPEYCHITTFVGGEELILPVVEVNENELDGDSVDVMATAPWKE